MRALLLGTIMLAGCAAGMGVGGRLAGEWRAVDINGVPVAGARPITLTLGDDGRASGNAGCNGYSAPFRLMSREGIEFGAIAVTEMACEPEVMAQEKGYLSILGSVSGYNRYSDGGISLVAQDGRAVRFRRP